MKHSVQKLARALFEEIRKHEADKADSVAEAFVAYLAEAHRMSDWRKVVRALDQVWMDEYGVANVDIVSAHELSKELIGKIETKVSGANVAVKTDPSRICGMSIRVDDRIVDGTLSTRLQSLKQHLAT